MFRVILSAVLLINACSSAPEIIEKPVPVIVPEFRDTTIFLRDTVLYKDSAWYGNVKDSVGKVIGNLKVYYKKKIAEIKINARTDTLILKDTIQAKQKSNVIQEISGLLPFWAEAILMAVAIGLLALVNRSSIKNLLKGLR